MTQNTQVKIKWLKTQNKTPFFPPISDKWSYFRIMVYLALSLLILGFFFSSPTEAYADFDLPGTKTYDWSVATEMTSKIHYVYFEPTIINYAWIDLEGVSYLPFEEEYEDIDTYQDYWYLNSNDVWTGLTMSLFTRYDTFSQTFTHQQYGTYDLYGTFVSPHPSVNYDTTILGITYNDMGNDVRKVLHYVRVNYTYFTDTYSIFPTELEVPEAPHYTRSDTGIEIFGRGIVHDTIAEDYVFRYRLKRVRASWEDWLSHLYLDRDVFLDARRIIFQRVDDMEEETFSFAVDYTYTFPWKTFFPSNYFRDITTGFQITHATLATKLANGDYLFYLEFEKDVGGVSHYSWSAPYSFGYFDTDIGEMTDTHTKHKEGEDYYTDWDEQDSFVQPIVDELIYAVSDYAFAFTKIFPFSWLMELQEIVAEAKDAGTAESYPSVVYNFDYNGKNYEINLFPMEEMMTSEDFLSSGYNVGDVIRNLRDILAMIIYVGFAIFLIFRARRFLDKLSVIEK